MGFHFADQKCETFRSNIKAPVRHVYSFSSKAVLILREAPTHCGLVWTRPRRTFKFQFRISFFLFVLLPAFVSFWNNSSIHRPYEIQIVPSFVLVQNKCPLVSLLINYYPENVDLYRVCWNTRLEVASTSRQKNRTPVEIYFSTLCQLNSNSNANVNSLSLSLSQWKNQRSAFTNILITRQRIMRTYCR